MFLIYSDNIRSDNDQLSTSPVFPPGPSKRGSTASLNFYLIQGLQEGLNH